MRLGTAAGPRLNLRVVGYEFPRQSDLGVIPQGIDPEVVVAADDDANWLVIEGVAFDGERSWTFREPCLQTWDLEDLAVWFEAVAAGDPVETIDFLEPNLAFEVIDSAVRITFELEARPPWRPRHAADNLDPVWIEVATGPDDLRRAASELRAALERFPSRDFVAD